MAEVKRLLDEGKVNKDDLISKEGSGQWHPASKYKAANSSKKENEKSAGKKPPSSDTSQGGNQSQDNTSEKSNQQTDVKQESQADDGSVTAKNSMTLREAIDEVLLSSATPLYYKDIAETIISEGLCENFGAKPSSSVYNSLSYSIREEKGKKLIVPKTGQPANDGEISCDHAIFD